MIGTQAKEAHKIIGYFSYTLPDDVFCDGDACIIAESEEKMKLYLKALLDGKRNIVKKARFGEIMKGLRLGGAYAFDSGSYERFSQLAKMNGINNLPPNDLSLGISSSQLRFIRIHLVDE